MAVEFIDAEPATAGVEFLDEPTGAGVEFLPDEPLLKPGEELPYPEMNAPLISSETQTPEQAAGKGFGREFMEAFQAAPLEGMLPRPKELEGSHFPGVRGAARAVESTAEGLITAQNAAIAAGAAAVPVLGRLAGIGFGAHMIKSAPDQIADAITRFKEGDVEGGVEGVTGTVLNVLMGGAAARHGTGSRPKAGGLLPGETAGDTMRAAPALPPLQAKSLASIGITPDTLKKGGEPSEPPARLETPAPAAATSNPLAAAEPAKLVPMKAGTKSDSKLARDAGKSASPEQIAEMRSELAALEEQQAKVYARDDITSESPEFQEALNSEGRRKFLSEAVNWEQTDAQIKEAEAATARLASQDLVAREPLIDPENQSAIPKHLRTDPELARLLNEPKESALPLPAEEAAALIKKAALEMKKPSGEGGFVNLDILADAGRAIYRKGIEFMEWSKEMIRSLGEAVKPHLDALWKSVSGQNIKPEFRESGGIFGVGKRVQPKGSTPLGDKEFIRIPTALKRAFRGLEREGSADVIGKTKNKVGQLLGKAIRKHVDTEQEIYGQHAAKFQKAVGKRTAASDKAFDELKPYLAAKENGRPLPALSGSAKRILGAWEDIAEETGLMAEAHKVQVFDPKINGHRPMHRIGRAYIPRMLKPEVERVMSDPQADPKLWNDLVDEISTQRGIPTDEAANYLRSEAGRFQSSDFMGNLEMARTAKLPEMFYEYDLRRIASRYLPSFAERMSQIIAYGQRLGTRDNPSRPNLWDIARKESEDAYTQKWLNSAEDQAVNLRPNGPAGRVAVRAQTLANAMLLSSPTTTVVRNLLSGLSATTEILGIRRSLAPLLTTATRARASMNAKEIGAVRDNMADFLHADQLGTSLVDDAIRSVTSAALKYSGYNGSETFVRSHGALVASQFAKDGIASISAKPASGRAREALAVFKRMGVDAAEIVKEKADWKTGPETRKFIRTVIRDSQGGYRFDQVPLWANSAVGRFFFQFWRYGTQRARNIWNNGVKPIVGTEVEWNGKKMVHRDVRPAIKMAASAVILGETFALIASGLFGRDRRDASIKEIRQAWDEDQKTAIGLAMQRALNDIIMAGTLGIWSQPVDFVKTLKDQSRFKNPAEPPGLASTKALMQLGMDALDQKGNLTMNDFLRFSSSVMPGPKQAVDVARNVFDEPLYEAQNDVRTLRNAAQRWATRSKMDIPAKPAGGFRKSENAPHYEKIQEALLVGDSKRARVIADKFIESQEDEKKANENLRSSVRNRQPFRAGPYTSAHYREDFMEWASKNLPKEDLNQVRRIQDRYMEAASDAELLR